MAIPYNGKRADEVIVGPILCSPMDPPRAAPSLNEPRPAYCRKQAQRVGTRRDARGEL